MRTPTTSEPVSSDPPLASAQVKPASSPAVGCGVGVSLGLELGTGLAVAVGDEEALVVGVGVDETNALEVGPHPTSATANEKATTMDARFAKGAVFMVSLI